MYVEGCSFLYDGIDNIFENPFIEESKYRDNKHKHIKNNLS